MKKEKYCGFAVGDRIEIITSKSKYKGKLGTISRVNVGNYGCIGIFIDGTIYQPGRRANGYSDILYAPQSLRKVKEDMAKLDDFNLVAKATHMYGYDTKKAFYFALYDSTVKSGDHAIVGSFSNPQIVKIEEVLNKDEAEKEWSSINKAIIGKVDATAYFAHEEKKAAMTKLRKEMDAKRKEIESRKDDEYYATLDPEYKEMLEKMKVLQA